MINYNLLQKNIDLIYKKLLYRNFKLDVFFLLQKEKKRKKLQVKTEFLRFQRNLQLKKNFIGKNKKNSKNFYVNQDKLNLKIKLCNEKLLLLQKSIKDYLLSIPNIPDKNIFITKRNRNLEIFRWGIFKTFDFLVKDHITLGKKNNILDFSSGNMLCGSKFVVIKGKLARLHRALSQFMLDIHVNQHGYQEYYVPYLINESSLYGSAQLPKFSNDIFYIFKKKFNKFIALKYALISTGELPLVNLVRNKILEENQLPLKFVTHTSCFRKESGSYGKKNKGLIRNHQFDKVELIQLVHPNFSNNALKEVVLHAEIVLQLLKLPYRKVLLSSKNLSFSSSITYDLEVWFPGMNNYQEISSCSNTKDFQARRLNAKFKNNIDKSLDLIHIINGSGLAIGRTLAAIMENYQQKDGTIKVPKILYPYMGGINVID